NASRSNITPKIPVCVSFLFEDVLTSILDTSSNAYNLPLACQYGIVSCCGRSTYWSLFRSDFIKIDEDFSKSDNKTVTISSLFVKRSFQPILNSVEIF